MTLYSSKTPRDLKDRWPDWRTRPLSAHYPQHNAPNPILVEFREWARNFGEVEYQDLCWWLGLIDSNEYPEWTPEQCAHAFRVIDRLATHFKIGA